MLFMQNTEITTNVPANCSAGGVYDMVWPQRPLPARKKHHERLFDLGSEQQLSFLTISQFN